MGQSMDVFDFHIKIKKDNIENARQAIINFAKASNANPIFYRFCLNQELSETFEDMNFCDMMENFGWIFDECITEKSNEYICLQAFEGECFCNDDELFAILAPHIEGCSYIELRIDYDYYYEWNFKNGKMLQANGEIQYEESRIFNPEIKLKPGYKWDKDKFKIVETEDDKAVETT